MSTIEFTPEQIEGFHLLNRPLPAPPGVQDIRASAATHFGVQEQDLVGPDRHPHVTLARHVAMFVVRERLKFSYPEIARAFGGRDHTTAIHAIRNLRARSDRDPSVRKHIVAVDRRLA